MMATYIYENRSVRNNNASEISQNPYMKSDLRIKNNKIKRQKELTKHIALTLCTILIISILAITFGSFLSKAKDTNSDVPTYKYFTSIQVKTGDSLYSIANEYIDQSMQSMDSYMNEVIHMNSLDSDTIHAGQYLIVPYYSTEFK